MANYEFALEKRLKELSAPLSERYKDTVLVVQGMLSRYSGIFPTFTDHTYLHSLEIIGFYNELLGEGVQQLNAEEIYILFMAALLHDVGMGISQKDYEEFSEKIDFGDYDQQHPNYELADKIRDFHHEFSGEFIKKYAELLDITDEDMLFAIVQCSRGHRRTDLYDEREYPSPLLLRSSGVSVSLPYLAALIRLADELDIAADRNLSFLYNDMVVEDAISIMEFAKHSSIKKLTIERERIVITADTDSKAVYDAIVKMKGKIDRTFDQCVDVVKQRTPYELTQRKIDLCLSLVQKP